MDYVLITPVKNEVENLDALMNAVLNQTKKPVLWVIVDSGSNDGSFIKASNLSSKIDWICVTIQANFPEEGYSPKNFAQAINEGYEIAKEKCATRGIKYDYVGKTDADIGLPSEYFEILANEMGANPKLAIICGRSTTEEKNTRKIALRMASSDILIGFHDIRLYRRDFFEEIKGYPLTYHPDTAILIKAINRNWGVRKSGSTRFIEIRPTGSRSDTMRGAFLQGEHLYKLDYSPILMLMQSAYCLFQNPPYLQGIAIALGYLRCAISGVDKVEDTEIREYFRKTRLKDLIAEVSNAKRTGD